MTDFTPGPWKRTTGGDWVIRPDGSNIALVRGQKDPVNQANARLIAAAPEMYEALQLVWNKVLTEYHVFDSPVRLMAEAALAAADGEDLT